MHKHLGLRFTYRGEAFNVRDLMRYQDLRDEIIAAVTGMRTMREIYFVDTVAESPAWLLMELHSLDLHTVQMNGIDDGFHDELYLMSCYGGFHQHAPNGHWLFDTPMPPHIVRRGL